MNKKYYVAAAIAAAISLFFVEQYVESLGYAKAEAEYQVKIDEMKADQESQKAVALAELREKEKQSQLALEKQNLKDAQHEKTIGALNRTLADRLRDFTYTTASCDTGTATSTDSGANDQPQGNGLLQQPFSELLQRVASEADQLNIAYQSCRSQLFADRGKLEPVEEIK